MDRIRFLRDFQGVATRERFYLAGAVVSIIELPTAEAVVEEGAAEWVIDPPAPSPDDDEPEPGPAPTAALESSAPRRTRRARP